MSLCVIYCTGESVLVCADSRVSAYENGIHYYIHDDCHKVRQYGNKVIFAAGNFVATSKFFNYVEDNDTVDEVVKKAKSVFNKYETVLKKRRPEDEGDQFGIYIFTSEKNRLMIYQVFHNENEWCINSQDVTGQNGFLAVAAHSKEAAPYADNLLKSGVCSDVGKIIVKTYEHFADEVIGGYLHPYVLFPNSILKCDTIKIKDSKLLNTKYDIQDNYHCDINGNLHLIGKLNAGSIISNSTIQGGSISIGTPVNSVYPFSVDNAGALIANKASIIGNIDCSSLKISGTNILDSVNKIMGDNLSDNSVGASKIKVNELYVGAGGIRLDPSAVISWGQVSSKPYIPQTASDVGALPVGTYIPDTNAITTISRNEISTATIKANQINGGTITGVTINVDTDLTVGNNIIIGSMESTVNKSISLNKFASIPILSVIV